LSSSISSRWLSHPAVRAAARRHAEASFDLAALQQRVRDTLAELLTAAAA
jgi:hypothetical protein